MKEKIAVGDLVEVDLDTGVGPFKGTVLAMSLVPETYEFTWYQIKPNSSNDMPGSFWYKDTEIKKIIGKESKDG